MTIEPDDDPRDFTFRPAEPASAGTLTTEQVDQFNTHGYVGGIGVIEGAELDALRAYIDDLVATVVKASDKRNSYSIINYQLVCRAMYELALTPAILDCVADIIGPDIVCWNTHVFSKPPCDPMAVPFHQDGVYWPLTPARTVTVWLAVDDADEGNAAMRFVAGSHQVGPIPHEEKALDGSRALKHQAIDPELYGPVRTNELVAGTMSLHSDLLLHGSPPNRSDRRRAAVTLRYAAAEVAAVPGAEWYLSPAVHCRGVIPDRWPNRRRPTSEHPELMAHVWGDVDGIPRDEA
jgi:ectoine hydroxylase-related dioxygenase (phytanoyl-CoA dioxygenase family)